MNNHLKNQTSPYLLQHADNPVEWYPWGEEAFERAKREDKPIFLSIGYSTCHWCHVMARESFSDEEIAEFLNRHFISIKVDREERPDLDSVYMSVCQALTGSGGWPMSIFMTANQRPFFAGTYFPPRQKYGGIGFLELLQAIARQWESNKRELLTSGERIRAHLEEEQNLSGGPLSGKKRDGDRNQMDQIPGRAAKQLSRSFDAKCGGFGNAPKFPMPHNLIFLVLYAKLQGDPAAWEQAKTTLLKMRKGGIFDQIGYGFSRYSTDRYFLVPHFEKMLYDNALLIMAYVAAYKADQTGAGELFLDTAKKTADYILREMTGPEGEFYSAQDADSEGGEGTYYVWSYEEICDLLGKERGIPFCEQFGITKQGNFEGKNIPNLLDHEDVSDAFEKERQTLYEYRKSRSRLSRDDKILTSWNSLMICAMAMLYRVTGENSYLQAAERACRFVEKHLTEGEELFVSCRDGARSVKGFLDEYACYAAALIALYEVTSCEKYLERAGKCCEEAARQFSDPKGGGYFLYGDKNSELILRPKETYDGALPSGNSVMAYCLVRLAQITGEPHWQQRALAQLSFLAERAEDYPAGCCMYLIALLFYLNPPQSMTLVMVPEDRKEECLRRLPLYADIKILEEPTKEYPLRNGRTTVYICRDHCCLPPVNV